MPAEKNSFVLLLIGLGPEQAQALGHAGFATQICNGAYDAAARIAGIGTSLRGVCVSTAALTPAVIQLIALVRKNFPQIGLFLAPGSTGRRAELAEKLGLARWETSAPAAAVTATIPDVSVAQPVAPQNAASKAPPAPARPVPPARHVVRMAPRPQTESAAPVKADNTELSAPAELPVEADIAARYDAENGDPILSDDELRALLDDFADPNDPQRT